MTAQGVSVNEGRPGQHREANWLKDWGTGLRRLRSRVAGRLRRRRPEGETAARHRAEVAYLAELYDDLCSGIRTWRDWDETLLCRERQEVAIEESAEALRQARADLALALNGGI